MITNIAITKLHPHPQNPRKELGDLAELAESIKARGVLQNLTVVPTKGGGADTDYTVIIGHRRLAASQMAGLSELPCSITEMDQKMQIATMLLENIQRSDLTVYEQAQGFQMMLDLGETVGGISQQTGFSDSTVRRRVKLLELDKDKFAQSIERGATFDDYDALNKIKNVKTRNKILEKIGTSNFDWELKSAIRNEVCAENKAVIVAAVKKFATKISDKETSKYQYGQYISLDKSDFTPPGDAGSIKYFYTESSHGVTLYKKRQIQEKPKKSPEEIELERKAKELKSLFKQAYELRLAFAKGFRGTGKTANAVDKKAIEILFDSSRALNQDVFRALFGIKDKFRQSWENKEKGETYGEACSRVLAVHANVQNTTLLFGGVYCRLEAPDAACLGWNGPAFSASERLAALYDFLTSVGYAMSDEEKALLDGSHELYEEADTDEDEGDEDYDEDEGDDEGGA